MKKFLSLLAIAMILSVVSTITIGCNSTKTDPVTDTTDTTDVTDTVDQKDTASPVASDGTIKGVFRKNTTLDTSVTYSLEGFVFVDSGITLTIPAGTQFKSSGKSALIVRPSAKIMAEGTAENPIVFTSSLETPNAGDWAGIVIQGKAPVSTSSNTLEFEAISKEVFGGTDSSDNSGVFKYVRIEYAGAVVVADQELNGLTLGGVGSGTTIEHVQVHAGVDDAFEWFGGNVNSKWLVATAYNDDGFDVDAGFTGTIAKSLNIQGSGSDKAIEAGSDAEGSHYTAPTFDGITIVSNGKKDVISLKDNVSGAYKNIFITGQSDSTKLITASGTTVGRINDATITLENIVHTDSAVVLDTIATKVNAALTKETQALGADCASPASANDAGAVKGDTLWYQGWTLENTVSCSE